MSNRFIWSFGKHVAFLTGTTAVISFAILTIAGIHHTREAHREGYEVLGRISVELLRRIATIDDDLRILSTGVRTPDQLAETVTRAETLLDYRPYYLGLRILGPEAVFEHTSEKGANDSLFISAVDIRAKGDSDRTRFAVDLEARRPVGAAPSKQPELLGYLVLSVHYALFQEAVFREDVLTPGRLSLIDPLGTVVYGPPLGEETLADLSSEPMLRRGCYYLARAVTFPGMAGEWTVVSSLPVSVLRSERRRELSTVLLLAAVIGVVLVGVSWNLAFESTRRRKYESRLRQKVREASSANRAKTAFLSNMSHELRTPMNGVVAMADLLYQQSLDQEHKSFAQLIRRSALQLLLVLETIIDYARLDGESVESGQTATDASLLLREVVETYADTADVCTRDIEIVLYADPRIPAGLSANPERLRQIFVSLVDNALKYTQVGHVTVSLSLAEDLGAAVRIRLSVEDTGCGMSEEQMVLAFTPFWQADQSDSRNFGGVGLSLASTKKLVELMGGNISVESAPGYGSVFDCMLELPKGPQVAAASDRVPGSLKGLRVVTLGLSNALVHVVADYLDYWGCESLHLDKTSLSDAEAPSLLRPDVIIAQGNPEGIAQFQRQGVRVIRIGHPRYGRSNPGCADDELTQPIVRESLFCLLGRLPVTEECSGQNSVRVATPRKTVLVADDDAMTREVVELVLRDQGYSVFSADNGRRAVEITRRIKPDLVVMDVSMPFLSGLDATREIRGLSDNRVASIPVIVLTARVFPGSAAQATRYGATAFLVKPAINERLVDLVRDLIG
ncbi:MAG: ATP-binding protein [Spirochaetaceae bacterium]